MEPSNLIASTISTRKNNDGRMIVRPTDDGDGDKHNKREEFIVVIAVVFSLALIDSNDDDGGGGGGKENGQSFRTQSPIGNDTSNMTAIRINTRMDRHRQADRRGFSSFPFCFVFFLVSFF